jgi:hypothetical protein
LPVDNAGATEFTPHRAVYEMSLNSGSGRGEVGDVAGLMEFEWTDACDGWAISYRTVMSIVYQNGSEVEIGWNISSWESKDGRRYRFFVKRLQGGEVTEEFRGEAELETSGGSGQAEYTLPETSTVKLPDGTLFPTAHSLRLLERMAEGDRFFWATLFDGSDASGLYGVNAVVTAQTKPESAAKAPWPLLADTRSSDVQLAFFRPGDESSLPESEQRLRLYDNGVVSEFILDYGDFSVIGKLKELKKLTPSC